MPKVISVTSQGQATIPKHLREQFGITTPGRVVMRETDEGILIDPVPSPESVGEELSKLAEQREGESGVAILRENRESDERFDTATRE